jgi:hypothetical protein
VLALGTGRLYPGTIVRPEGLVNKKSQRPHGNETGDFPACSAVPQRKVISLSTSPRQLVRDIIYDVTMHIYWTKLKENTILS